MNLPPLSGFLLIDKPSGPTSHDVVDAVRRAAAMRAVGHAGTLDPFATGLLIVGLGRATKRLSHIVGQDKEYRATLQLGSTSDTFDPEGVITENQHVTVPSQGALERALDLFRGGYEQAAPLYSAKKQGGKKLYDLARAGLATEEMRPRTHVTIHTIEVLAFAFPLLTLRIRCGTGTYIRSLADDIGRALGIGAYVIALRRTAIGSFSVDHALPITHLNRHEIEDKILSLEHVFPLDNGSQNAYPGIA